MKSISATNLRKLLNERKSGLFVIDNPHSDTVHILLPPIADEKRYQYHGVDMDKRRLNEKMTQLFRSDLQNEFYYFHCLSDDEGKGKKILKILKDREVEQSIIILFQLSDTQKELAKELNAEFLCIEEEEEEEEEI